MKKLRRWFCVAESSAAQVQTSAKSVRPLQITHRNSGLWLAEEQEEIF